MSKKILPSMLSFDFNNLDSVMSNLSKHKIDEIHYDVMDGHFVPAISFGSDILDQVANGKKVNYDVHLMVSDPAKHLERYFKDYVSGITWHYEALTYKEHYNLLKELTGINFKKNGAVKNKISKKDKKQIDSGKDKKISIEKNRIKLGMSIKPRTNIEQIYEFLEHLDIILVMSVEPGKGGQEFIPNSLKKIKRLRDKIDTNKLNTKIYVDGGINEKTAKLCFDAGADAAVAGSYIFKSKEPSKRIKALNDVISKYEK